MPDDWRAVCASNQGLRGRITNTQAALISLCAKLRDWVFNRWTNLAKLQYGQLHSAHLQPLCVVMGGRGRSTSDYGILISYIVMNASGTDASSPQRFNENLSLANQSRVHYGYKISLRTIVPLIF